MTIDHRSLNTVVWIAFFFVFIFGCARCERGRKIGIVRQEYVAKLICFHRLQDQNWNKAKSAGYPNRSPIKAWYLKSVHLSQTPYSELLASWHNYSVSISGSIWAQYQWPKNKKQPQRLRFSTTRLWECFRNTIPSWNHQEHIKDGYAICIMFGSRYMVRESSEGGGVRVNASNPVHFT